MNADNLVARETGSDNFKLFIKAPKDSLSDRGMIVMQLEYQGNNKKYQIDTIFIWQ